MGGLDLNFTAEEIEYRDRVAAAFEASVAPLVRSLPDAPLPLSTCRKLIEFAKPLGLLGARVPVASGGTGVGATKLSLASELLPFEAWETIMLPEILAFRIALAGTPDLQQRLIPRLLNGEFLAGSATSEPEAGSDPQAIATTATPEGDGFRIRGKKSWCAGANVADILLVVASRGRDDRGRNILTPFIVEKSQSPFEAKPCEMTGLRGANIADIELDCWVPRENMIGAEAGKAHELLHRSWLSQRPIMGLASNNISRRAFRSAVDRAKSRSQFNRKIGSFQMIQSMVADMATAIDASRLLCYRAIRMAEAGQDCMKETAMAKYFAVKSSLEITTNAVEVCGASGTLRGEVVEACFRDARTLAFIEGTMEIQKLIIGREVLGLRAFS